MAIDTNFNDVFNTLKANLRKLENNFVVKADEPGNYYLDTKYKGLNKKDIMFAAVQIKKNYVSYHLFPVYVFPSLLNDLSDRLKKHMQGKACFNFKKVDKELFDELDRLTKKGMEKFKLEKDRLATSFKLE